ncbi:MAG TPA: DinB family protein [bacterium]|nr:DinB family protein [bacterium]
MRPAEAYDYLVEARGRVFDRVRALPQAQYTRRQPFGLGSIRATLVHMADIEWWYTSMLEGDPPGSAPFPFRAFSRTGFPPLESAWGDLAGRTRRALGAGAGWERPIEDRWTTKRWTHGIHTTANGVAVQLLFHEVHHRAQVMAMLRLLGRPVQGVDYSLMRWQWTKEHR